MGNTPNPGVMHHRTQRLLVYGAGWDDRPPNRLALDPNDYDLGLAPNEGDLIRALPWVTTWEDFALVKKLVIAGTPVGALLPAHQAMLDRAHMNNGTRRFASRDLVVTLAVAHAVPPDAMDGLGEALYASATNRGRLQTILAGGAPATAAANRLLLADNPVSRKVYLNPALMTSVLAALPADAAGNLARERIRSAAVAYRLEALGVPHASVAGLAAALTLNGPELAQLETALAGGPGAAPALRGMLDHDTAVARLILDRMPVLQRLLDGLPNDRATLDELQTLELALVGAAADVMAPFGLTQEAHRAMYRKRTDAAEQAVHDRLNTPPALGDPRFDVLRNLDPQSYWKLLIDGKAQHHDDKHFYDRSQGYMAAMMRSLDQIIDDVANAVPMDPDYFIGLHETGSELVTLEIANGLIMGGTAEDERQAKLCAANFQEVGHFKQAKNMWGMQFVPALDMVGRAELLVLQGQLEAVVDGNPMGGPPLPLDPRPFFATDPFGQQGPVTVSWSAGDAGATAPELEAQVRRMITHVLQELTNALATATANSLLPPLNPAHLNVLGLEDAKLDAIIDACRLLGMIHPFKDANGRLMMFVTLNRLLLENGLSPTILHDQGCMVGQNRNALKALIRQGQGNGNLPGPLVPMGAAHFRGVQDLTANPP